MRVRDRFLSVASQEGKYLTMVCHSFGRLGVRGPLWQQLSEQIKDRMDWLAPVDLALTLGADFESSSGAQRSATCVEEQLGISLPRSEDRAWLWEGVAVAPLMGQTITRTIDCIRLSPLRFSLKVFMTPVDVDG